MAPSWILGFCWALGYQWYQAPNGHTHFNTPNKLTCYNPDDSGGAWGDTGLTTASSNHPGGVNVCFTDGSVRFVKDSVSPQPGGPSAPGTAARPSAPTRIELNPFLQDGIASPARVVHHPSAKIGDLLDEANRGRLFRRRPPARHGGLRLGDRGVQGMPKDLTPPFTDNIPKADMAAGKRHRPSKDPAKAQAAKAAADNPRPRHRSKASAHTPESLKAGVSEPSTSVNHRLYDRQAPRKPLFYSVSTCERLLLEVGGCPGRSDRTQRPDRRRPQRAPIRCASEPRDSPPRWRGRSLSNGRAGRRRHPPALQRPRPQLPGPALHGDPMWLDAGFPTLRSPADRVSGSWCPSLSGTRFPPRYSRIDPPAPTAIAP